jgi:uncharacterized protein
MLTGIYLLQTGRVEADLRHLSEIFTTPYLAGLIERKRAGGELNAIAEHEVNAFAPEYQRLNDLLDNAFAVTTLPEKIAESTREAMHEFVLQIRSQHFL